MAKKKSSNPVDAARKAARARELKKNKAEREKVREVVTVRKDTKGLEADIRRLQAKEKAGTLSKPEAISLSELKTELSRITSAKESYVAAHPEHRKFVYGKEIQEGGDDMVFGEKKKGTVTGNANASASGSGSGNGNGNGVSIGMGGDFRDPKRSVYYHEIFNPLGAPPPGMPYLEKPAEQWDPPFGIPTYTGPPPSLDPSTSTFQLPSTVGIEGEETQDPKGEEEEEEEEESDEEDSDDEIPLPSGPAPSLPDLPSAPFEPSNPVDQDSDSESDIVMPEGPPPPPSDFQPPLPPIPTGPKNNAPPLPPSNYSQPPPSYSQPPPPHFYSGPPPPLPFPPPPNQYQGPSPPFPPPGFRGGYNGRGGDRGRGTFDRGGRGGIRGRGNFQGNFALRNQPQGEVFDPLSSDGKAHETFRQHSDRMREKSRENSNGVSETQDPSISDGINSLPSKPESQPQPPKPSATISAAPQLRDLKKEVTAFLPPSMRRKIQKEKERKEMGLPNAGQIISAPVQESDRGALEDRGERGRDGDELDFKKPNLLNALKGRLEDPLLGGKLGRNGEGEIKKKRKNDDYDKFLNEMGDLL